ncbi:DUF2384 domain-containing protein [Massilia litorea]|uniref:DUF2384 domain-containing protein n=1 Tax=Massilia litorea TaxID=2769491 RepID=A0A7L9UAI1_9BURK|nr:DUF2384 domain-containing protein [Massilia litorea]
MGALRARFEAQSRKAQAYYAVMHAVRSIVGSDEAASSWMESPQAALEGQTPAQLIAAGREDAVLEQVQSLQAGR